MEEGLFESSDPSILSKYKYPILLGLVGTVLLVGGIFSSGTFNKTFVKSYQSTTKYNNTTQSIASQIKVDISGAVINPGVYNLSNDARIQDAIKVAGGVSSEADTNYLTKNINLAQKVTDGMKLYIPKKGESATVLGESTKQSSLISINQGTEAELESLSGVGPATAQKIIDNRPYSALEDLTFKKVVSKTVFEKIKQYISL